ncbi:MAG: hypothetical protein KJ886_06545, partial [Candidatus Thermoplasmatota archaeon]|nr:hypothetical protein [Candidatus Thermoplasmatota archaeon]
KIALAILRFTGKKLVFLLSKIANAILRFTGKKLVFLLSKIANAILRFTGKKLCFPALQKLPEQFLDGGNLFKHRVP